jgi:hypothetical protein
MDKPDQKAIDQYMAHFQPGQEKLKEAFGAYVQAKFEKDPDKKAELMLLANDLVGLHEQTRLQPDIAKALNAPVEVMFKGIVKDTIKEQLGSIPFGAGKWLFNKLDKSGVLDKAIQPLTNELEGVWRKVATDQLMKLETPKKMFSLGKDLAPDAGKPEFARDLQTIENPRLREVLSKIDRTPDSLKGSGAKDWSNLDDRMNYIGDLFRSGQQDKTLWTPPFGHAGTYPVGKPHVS